MTISILDPAALWLLTITIIIGALCVHTARKERRQATHTLALARVQHEENVIEQEQLQDIVQSWNSMRFTPREGPVLCEIIPFPNRDAS